MIRFPYKMVVICGNSRGRFSGRDQNSAAFERNVSCADTTGATAAHSPKSVASSRSCPQGHARAAGIDLTAICPAVDACRAAGHCATAGTDHFQRVGAGGLRFEGRGHALGRVHRYGAGSGGPGASSAPAAEDIAAGRSRCQTHARAAGKGFAAIRSAIDPRRSAGHCTAAGFGDRQRIGGRRGGGVVGWAVRKLATAIRVLFNDNALFAAFDAVSLTPQAMPLAQVIAGLENLAIRGLI